MNQPTNHLFNLEQKNSKLTNDCIKFYAKSAQSNPRLKMLCKNPSSIRNLTGSGYQALCVQQMHSKYADACKNELQLIFRLHMVLFSLLNRPVQFWPQNSPDENENVLTPRKISVYVLHLPRLTLIVIALLYGKSNGVTSYQIYVIQISSAVKYFRNITTVVVRWKYVKTT